MDDCSNCLVLKTQVEDLKQKHLVDFRTIKQKIISTDTLIRSYQVKCQEYDKQKKYVVELTSKFDGAQRSVEVIKLQLKKSLELKEPLQKKCHELERERVHQCAEIESLQDRVKGFENLVCQLQSVIKENEISRHSMTLDASIHSDEIEELKKSQKKNEAQISKLTNQLLAEKKTNKALKKELIKSQNHGKALLEETQESKKLIIELQEQLNAGQHDHCEQERNILLEKQKEEYQKIIKQLKDELWHKAKQENTNDDKNLSDSKIKSPVKPRKSPRKWKNITPKQEESSEILEQKRPLTRLQQKNLILEVEKKSVELQEMSPVHVSPSQHKSEELEMGILLDIVNEMLDAPYCPPLSPLPPSPFLDRNSVGEFGNNDYRYTCGDQNTIERTDKDYLVDIDNHCNEMDDNITNIDHKRDGDNLETKDLEKSGGKKRELEEFCGPSMSLRSGKKRKNGNSELRRRTKSDDMTLERNDVPVTRSRSVEETSEGVLEVKLRRRRRKRKLSSNDGDSEQPFESSDTSTADTNTVDSNKQLLDTPTEQNNVFNSTGPSSHQTTGENNVANSNQHSSDIPPTAANIILDSRKQSSDIALAETNALHTREQSSDVVETAKHSDGRCEEDKNMETKNNDIFQSTMRTRSMDKLDKEDMGIKTVCCNKETSHGARNPSARSQTDTRAVLQTSPLDDLVKMDTVVAEREQTEQEKKGLATASKNNIETTLPVIRWQTWPRHGLSVAGKRARSEEQSYSDLKPLSRRHHLENKCSESTAVTDESAAERNCRESNEVLREIIDTVVNATRNVSSTSEKRTSAPHDQSESKNVPDCQDTEAMKHVVPSDHVKSLGTTVFNSNIVQDNNTAWSTSIGKTKDIEDKHVKLAWESINVVDTENIKSLEPLKTTSTSKTTFLRESELVKPKNHSPTTHYKTTIETTSSKVESEKSTESPTTELPQESSVSLEEQLEPISTPLSPIPNTPRKNSRSVNIPSFDSLDHLPLSPIPPSPPPAILSSPLPIFSSPPSKADEGECSPTNSTFPEDSGQNPEEVQVTKKQNVKRNELPTNALLRYPGVNEMQFTVFIFTKLKNREITMEDLITAFSVRKNVRNHTPIASGLVSVLKFTPEGDEHVLMEKYAEHYKHDSEGAEHPIVSEFEMQVLIAVNRLSKIQRHSNLLSKLVKLLAMNLCQLFPSEKSDAGVLAICRIYAGVCRLLGEGSHVRVLCYDILKQNRRYPLVERMILSIAHVWPDVLGKGLDIVTIHTESLSISGHHSFLATLQTILMSREMSCERSKQCLQGMWGCCDVSEDRNVLEWLARDLVRVLRATSATPSQGSPENAAFETIKSLELLAVVMGWKWTNDILIREILWPVFKDWKTKGFNLKQSEHVSKTEEAQSSLEVGTILHSVVENVLPVNCQAISNDTPCSVRTELNVDTTDAKTRNVSEHVGRYHDHNMDTMIQNVLRLFGFLGNEILRKGERINLECVINLMCAIVSDTEVSYSVQHSAANALLDLISFDPLRIIHVLGDWIKRCSKINEISTAQFERRMKDVRTHMWTT